MAAYIAWRIDPARVKARKHNFIFRLLSEWGRDSFPSVLIVGGKRRIGQAKSTLTAAFRGPFYSWTHMPVDIDPIEFGRVLARLDEQDKAMSDMRSENKEMRDDIKRLLAMANQGKGGLWMFTSVSALIGALLAEIARYMLRGH
jgi:hypothetical protein